MGFGPISGKWGSEQAKDLLEKINSNTSDEELTNHPLAKCWESEKEGFACITGFCLGLKALGWKNPNIEDKKDKIKDEYIKDKISKTEKRIIDMRSELEIIESLAETYPDLYIACNRWGKEFFTSKLVINKETHCDITHSCGCCDDAPLQAFPYLIDEETGQKIHHPDVPIHIGHGCWCGGEEPNKKWKEKFTNPAIVEIIEKYFKDSKCTCMDDEDEDDLDDNGDD